MHRRRALRPLPPRSRKSFLFFSSDHFLDLCLGGRSRLMFICRCGRPVSRRKGRTRSTVTVVACVPFRVVSLLAGACAFDSLLALPRLARRRMRLSSRLCRILEATTLTGFTHIRQHPLDISPSVKTSSVLPEDRNRNRDVYAQLGTSHLAPQRRSAVGTHRNTPRCGTVPTTGPATLHTHTQPPRLTGCHASWTVHQ